MFDEVTLDEVEELASRLPAEQRLKLVARICERLSPPARAGGDDGDTEDGGVARIDAWLAECDAVAESVSGAFDSAEDVRLVREERAHQA